MSKMRKYTIYSWDISETTPPHPMAGMGPQKVPGDQTRQVWYVNLTDEEVVELSNRYDIMILGAWTEKTGTRKHPIFTEHLPQIRLCEKGCRFRQH